MTSINYDEIFSYFLGIMTDYNFASLETSEQYELMGEWMHKAASEPYVRRLFSSILFDDEINVLSFELDYPIEEFADRDFILLVLSKGMLIEWLKPQVRSTVNIAQMFSGKEQRYFSQSQHISELRGLLEDSQLELRKMIRDRGYINNSYLEEQ